MPNRIRELRKQNGLTMKRLGDIIGIAENVVSRYETGKRQPDIETQVKLSRYFNVTVGYLMGVEDSQDTETDSSPDPVRQAAMDLFDTIPEDRRAVALEYLRFLAQK